MAAFLKCQPAEFVKTLIYLADEQPVVVIIPGDRELNEHKLKQVLGAKTLTMADDTVIQAVTGAAVGFAGPIGLTTRIYADISLENATNLTTGANKNDLHIRNVDIKRDAQITAYEDLVIVQANDCCPRCQKKLQMKRGIEVGHVFKLGTKYSESFDATYLNDHGESLEMVMGCYGIGVTRTLQAVIEQSNDKDGIIWPISVAPFAVTILNLDPSNNQVNSVVAQLEQELVNNHLDVFIDDRAERPGVKFKDADLIGCPVRVVVGARGLAANTIEVKQRGSQEMIATTVENAACCIIELACKLFKECQP